MAGRPRKPPELRKHRRRYPGEEGYKPPRAQRAVRRPQNRSQRPRKPPMCDFPSLGPGIWAWAAEHLTVPDGPFAGERLELRADQTAVLYRWYEVDESGGFVYRRGCWQAAQGTGKSPLLAVIALAELCGPSRFGGVKDGKPFGVAPATAHVQCAAVSEDQSRNTFAAAYSMAVDSDLPLDVGLTRIHTSDGKGLLEPVTASAGSRHGQRPTFVVCDETHYWTSLNRGHWLADTLRRNTGKVNGRTFESTNAFRVGEDSVAERTADAAGSDGLLHVSREVPPVEDLTDAGAVRAALEVAYGDAATDKGGWVDLDRLVAEITDPGSDEDSMRRFYMNQTTAGGSCPFDMERWKTLAIPVDIDPKKVRGLGFDGSQSRDGTAFYGATDDGHVFEIGNWFAPPGASKTWKVPRDEVMEVLRDALTAYKNAVLYADPPLWQNELAELTDEFSTPRSERVVAVPTASAVRFAPQCERFATAIFEGYVSHDGDSTLTEALSSCVRKQVRLRDDPEDGRSRFVVEKAKPRKNDAAIAAILAFSAAMEAPAPPPRIEDNIWG
jgi:hypothetical protein